MKITKTVEIFDCTQFEKGKIYYIQWRDDSEECITQAIYLCVDVDTELNRVLFNQVLVMRGTTLKNGFSINNTDLPNILDVQPVDFTTMYDSLNPKWQITAEFTVRRIGGETNV